MIHRLLGGADVWFTDRHGGVSVPPFASLNLALHVGDAIGAVTENRRRVRHALGLGDRPWNQPHQVHGTTVVAVLGHHDSTTVGQDADGVATGTSGVLLSAIGADCAPIAIANDTACAAIHAGWRGATSGIVASGVAAVRALGTGEVRAVVGPCVCGAHYEFGEGLLAALAADLGPAVVTSTAAGAPAFDLRVAIRIAFERAEVSEVEVLDICTVESSDHFSYRRDGLTGRHGVVVVKR